MKYTLLVYKNPDSGHGEDLAIASTEPLRVGDRIEIRDEKGALYAVISIPPDGPPDVLVKESK